MSNALANIMEAPTQRPLNPELVRNARHWSQQERQTFAKQNPSMWRRLCAEAQIEGPDERIRVLEEQLEEARRELKRSRVLAQDKDVEIASLTKDISKLRTRIRHLEHSASYQKNNPRTPACGLGITNDEGRLKKSPVFHDADEKIAADQSGRRARAARMFEAEMERAVLYRSVFASANGITVNDILSTRRAQDIVRVRQALAWFLNEYTALSFTVIGDIMNKDHATIMYSIARVKAEETKALFAPYIERAMHAMCKDGRYSAAQKIIDASSDPR